MKKNLVIGFLFLLSLFWLWPNFVHEPLHLLALKLQGLDGSISFDWHFPSHPFIEKHGQVQSVLAGLFFLLLPSIFSLFVLWALWLTRSRAGLLTHIMLPAYLATDLVVNIVKYDRPTSDFYFLSAFPQAFAILIALSVFALFTITILKNTECFVQLHGQASKNR